jgi:benzodiazapine receptor
MNQYILSFIILFLTVFMSNKHIDLKKDSEWYQCIRPKITPPNWTFGLVWSFLYILLFFALAKVLKTGNKFIISLFIINLFLQVLWSYSFFNIKRLDTAFLIIQFLLLTATIIIMYSNNDVRYLLYPYVGWLTYAITINILAVKEQENC